MRMFFSWCPLVPPAPGNAASPALSIWANTGALIFLGLGLLQVAFGLVDGWVRFVPLGIGLLTFGLPHGAIDHLVALGLAGKPLRPLPLAVVLTLYLAVVMAVLALWFLLPLVAAIGFLIMTIYHWGKSDLAFERCGIGERQDFRGGLGNGIHGVLRGLIPIGLPFIIFPDQAAEFINACLRFFTSDHQIDGSLWRHLITVAFVIFFAGDLSVHLRHGKFPLARRIVVENFALTLFFCLVPPLIAIGCYFAGWHGFRHLLRLSRYGAAGQPTAPELSTAMSRLGWQALPFTVVSVMMLAGMLIWMAAGVSTIMEGTALYLVLVSALTLPHLIIVEWMDRSESISAGLYRTPFSPTVSR